MEDDGESSACTAKDWNGNSGNVSDVPCESGQPKTRLPFTTTCVEHDDILISCAVTSISPLNVGATVHKHERFIL